LRSSKFWTTHISFSSLWRLLGHRRKQRLLRARPQLEALEERCVPTLVTSLLDDGTAGTLRSAIAAALTSDHTVTFQSGLTGTITLGSTGALLINGNLNITGPGASTIAVSGLDTANPLVTIDSEVFDLELASGTGFPFNVSISGLTIENGLAPFSGAHEGEGGGMFITGGGGQSPSQVQLTNLIFNNNTAQGGLANNSYDGTEADGGGLYTTGTALTITSTVFTANQVKGGNGDNWFNIPHGGGQGGYVKGAGLCVEGGTVNIVSSTISSNVAAGGFGGNFDVIDPGAGAGGYAFGGGLFAANATVNVITNSTISSNAAVGGTGGDFYSANLIESSEGGRGRSAWGAGLYLEGGTYNVSSSTISANVTTGGNGGEGDNGSGGGPGGDSFGAGFFAASGTLTVSNSTIANNTAGGTVSEMDPRYHYIFLVTGKGGKGGNGGNGGNPGNGGNGGNGGGGGPGGINQGGGIANYGGGTETTIGTVNLRNVTVAFNQANAGGIGGAGGAGGNGVAGGNGGTGGNGGNNGGTGGVPVGSTGGSGGTGGPGQGGNGGGIFNQAAGELAFGGTVQVVSTIIAKNTVAGSGASGPDLFGAFVTQGHNLIGDSSASTGFVFGANGDLVGGNGQPVIDPLFATTAPASNGGPTLTLVLTASSPALKKGSNPDNLTYDQRGAPFSRTSDGLTDIGAVTLPVTPASTQITLGTSANPAAFGQTVTFTATVSTISPSTATPTGMVTFKEGSTALGTAPVNNGVAIFQTANLQPGSHTLTAVYAADTGNDKGSTSTALTERVKKAATTVTLTSSGTPVVFGQAVTLTARLSVVSPGVATPSGSVTFKNGSTVLGTGTVSNGVATFTTAKLTVASHRLTAVYAGNSTSAGSTSAALTETVNKASTQVSLSGPASPVVFGQAATLTATLSVVSPGVATPSGSVTFKDGSTVLGRGTVSNGIATFTTTKLSVASHNITAVYAGNSTSSGSTSAITMTVNKAPTQTTLSASANPLVFGQTVTLKARLSVVLPGAATPTGTVTFMDGSTVLGTGRVSKGVATLRTAKLTVASHNLTAVYGGDSTSAGSTSALLTVTVN